LPSAATTRTEALCGPGVRAAAGRVTAKPTWVRPGKGVDLVIDDVAYGTAYGAGRADVAAFFMTPGLTQVGFAVTLPAAALTPGPHKASVRVVAADGKSYYQGLAIAFEAK
jgi:hypothetical protein